jgi:hypothetical protein
MYTGSGRESFLSHWMTVDACGQPISAAEGRLICNPITCEAIAGGALQTREV